MLNLFGAPHDRKRRSLCIDVVSPASFKQRPRNASSIGIVGTLSITKNIVFQIPSYKSTQTQRYSLLNVKQSNHSLYSTSGYIDVDDGCWSRNDVGDNFELLMMVLTVYVTHIFYHLT